MPAGSSIVWTAVCFPRSFDILISFLPVPGLAVMADPGICLNDFKDLSEWSAKKKARLSPCHFAAGAGGIMSGLIQMRNSLNSPFQGMPFVYTVPGGLKVRR